MNNLEVLIMAGLFYAFAGSLHCVGMCGPMVSLVPCNKNTLLSHTLYHCGRILSYGMLGALCGLMGQGLVLKDFRGSISLLAGLLMVVILTVNYLRGRNSLDFKLPWQDKVQKVLKFLLLNKNLDPVSSSFVFGVFNGLLPCGFLYVGFLAAAGTESLVGGWLLMICFGLGTVPALSLVLFLREHPLFIKFQRSAFSLVLTICVSLLLISRGGGQLFLNEDTQASGVCHTVEIGNLLTTTGEGDK